MNLQLPVFKFAVPPKGFMLLGLILFFYGSPTEAHDIRVLNARVLAVDNQGADIQFDLDWKSSWRDEINWDAAWVFAKYRVRTTEGGDGLWRHVWLNPSAANHSVGQTNGIAATFRIGTTAISGTERGMGAFIYRTNSGGGNINWQNVRLRWDFAAQGIDGRIAVEIRVFAIEMVHVAEGPFSLGTGGIETFAFRQGAGTLPFTVTAQGSLQLSDQAGNLWAQSSGAITAGTTNAGFPTGFRAFYMMKYEVSQQQYVDFLNMLTRTQQNTRTATDLSPALSSVTNRFVMYNSSTLQFRNGIRVNASITPNAPITFYCDLGNNGVAGESNDGLGVAANYLNWMDGAAYADWAGLRPMSELEYEKAARGPGAPLTGEYAWGTASVTVAETISSPGGVDEQGSFSTSNAAANNQGSVQGPIKVGGFATANSDRIKAGASFWGIMELSGNVQEPVVSLATTTGQAFSGLHGDGSLSTNGNADVVAWPGLSSGEVTTATGSGTRGGGWISGVTLLRVSDRNIANSAPSSRDSSTGFRGVRTAP